MLIIKASLATAEVSAWAWAKADQQKRNLRRHYLSFHGIVSQVYLRLPETPYKVHKCEKCGKLFDRKERLAQHQKVKMCLFCPNCKFRCNDETSLLDHTNKTHIKCTFCNFQTVHKFNLNKHVKAVQDKVLFFPPQLYYDFFLLFAFVL